MIYRFDSFELDRSQYRLSRGETPIRVKPKVLELLAYLVEHRERVVGKEELLSTIWEGRFVGDGVLPEAIHEARRALGDNGERVSIRTVHGRGYQFVSQSVQVVGSGGDADDGAAARGGELSYCLSWTGGMTTLMPGQNFIGRDSTCLIVLAGRLVSRRHARVDVTEGGAVVNDLGSKNGTRVNGERIAAPTTLSDGDTIGIGGFELTFRERESGASTLTSVGSSIDL